jgi:hypothetical protein
MILLSCHTTSAEARRIRHNPERRDEVRLCSQIETTNTCTDRRALPSTHPCHAAGNVQRILGAALSGPFKSPRFIVVRMGHAVSRISDCAVTVGSYLERHSSDLLQKKPHFIQPLHHHSAFDRRLDWGCKFLPLVLNRAAHLSVSTQKAADWRRFGR